MTSFISTTSAWISVVVIVYALGHTLFSIGRVLRTRTIATVVESLTDSPLVPHNGSRSFSPWLFVACIASLAVCTVLGTSILTALTVHTVTCGSMKLGYIYGGAVAKTVKAASKVVANKVHTVAKALYLAD